MEKTNLENLNFETEKLHSLHSLAGNLILDY